jgi:hypothetical protein
MIEIKKKTHLMYEDRYNTRVQWLVLQEEPNNGGIVSCTTTLDLKIISL